MIVRIINEKRKSDKLIDCRNTCVMDSVGKEKDTVLIIGYMPAGEGIEIVLSPGDEIYYMNDTGKTVHVDRRMYNR